MSSDSQKHINQGTASSTALLKARNAMRDRERKLEEAQNEPDPKKRAEATKKAMQGMRDAQTEAVANIGAQFLKGDDKKRFVVGLQAVSLLRDRMAADKSLIPSIDDLLFDPDGVKSCWCATIWEPTLPTFCMSGSRRKRRIASSNASSGIIHPNMAVGSTSPNVNSRCFLALV